MKLTTNEIYEKCKEFNIGDEVIINFKKPRGNSDYVIVKKRGVIAGRYPKHLLVRNEKGINESFTYSDIVQQNMIERG